MCDITVGHIWHEADLEVDRISSTKTRLHLRDSVFGMAIKGIEVTDSVMAEEWSCHRTMKFPHFPCFSSVLLVAREPSRSSFTIRIKNTRPEDT
jgi:hypothetical protein